MKHIKDNISKKEFEHFYLLYGDEEYLKRSYKNSLKKAIVDDDDMNLTSYSGKDMNLNDVRESSISLPFFAEYRLIILEDTGCVKNASEEMLDIVTKAADSTIFIFVEAEVDKRNKMYKFLSSKGYACEMKTPNVSEISLWLGRQFKAAGKNITSNTMEYFLKCCGQNSSLDLLENEALKLTSYVGERTVIERSDVDAVCTVQVEDRIFDMLEAISLGDADRVMNLYSDLVALKEAPIKILVMLGRQFSQLLSVKSLLLQGKDNKTIISEAKIMPFLVGKYIKQAQTFTIEELQTALEDCLKADYSIKSGQMSDAYAVELLIIKYSNRNRGTQNE